MIRLVSIRIFGLLYLEQIGNSKVGQVRLLTVERTSCQLPKYRRRNEDDVVELANERIALIDLLQRDKGDWYPRRCADRGSRIEFGLNVLLTVHENGKSVAWQHLFEFAATHSKYLSGFTARELAVTVQRSHERLASIDFVNVEPKPVWEIDCHFHRASQSLTTGSLDKLNAPPGLRFSAET